MIGRRAPLEPVVLVRAAELPAGKVLFHLGRMYTVVRAMGTDDRAPVILEERKLGEPQESAVQLCLMSLRSVRELMKSGV